MIAFVKGPLDKSPKPPWIFTYTVINELLNEEEIEKKGKEERRKEWGE